MISGVSPARASQNAWSDIDDDIPDYSEARSFLAKKNWAEAAILLRSTLAKSPDFSLAAVDLARALLYLGRREEALSVLGQAINHEIGPRRIFLIRRMRVVSRVFTDHRVLQACQDGLELLEGKKYRAAKEKFLRALEQDPQNVELNLRLGQTMLLDNDIDSAAERLKLAERLNPFEPEIHLWLGRALHQRGELNDALDRLKLAANELPGSELAPMWLAEAQVSLGQKKAGIQTLEADLNRQPFHLAGLMTQAKLQIRGSSPRDLQGIWAARKDLQIALSRLPKYVSPEVPRFETELGVSLARIGEDLQEEIEKLLKQTDSKLRDTSRDSN